MKNILWLPLDLPPVPKEITLENIESLYNYIPNFSSNEQAELAKNKQFYKYAWNSYRLREIEEKEASWESQNSEELWRWTAESRLTCPKLIQYIEDHLPLKKIRAASIMSSRGTVPAHFDMSPNLPHESKNIYIDNEPSMYRLLLDGIIKENSFYVASPSKKSYINLPTDSPGWVMGSFSCTHGNDEEVPYQKIILYIIGEVDIDRHQTLVNKSYEKYKEYAILI